jgi:4-amino-4-deoxy-L-arabinose transferase-like glycosyltransferase
MRKILKRDIPILSLVLLLLIIVTIVIRIPIIHNRSFCTDEFEHLHAARSISHGEVIYRDFFEHHTPFIHFLLAPLFWIFGDSISVLFISRWIMLFFTCGILYLTYFLTKKIYGSLAGLCAALCLNLVLMFVSKTIETRPDMLSVCFWLLTLIFFLDGITRWKPRYFILSGAMLSNSIMCTPKALFAMVGFGIGLAWFLLDWNIGRSRRDRLKSILWIGVGFAIPVCIFCFYFLVNGALDDFIYRNFIMNLKWKRKFSPNGGIASGLRHNPFFFMFGAAGLLVATLGLFLDRKRLMTFMPVISTYMLIWGLYLMPVPFPQYYMLFLPLFAMYNGMMLQSISEHISWDRIKQYRKHYIRITLIVIGAIVFVYILVRVLRFSSFSEPVKWDSWKLYWIVWIFCLVGILLAVWRHRRKYVALFLLICFGLYPFNQILTETRTSNQEKLREISYVLEHTTPEDTVMDGWSGLGVFRDHAYYYYFVHKGIRPMMTKKERSEDVIRALREKNTRIVIYDGNVRDLSASVREYIEANYRSTGVGSIYIRK